MKEFKTDIVSQVTYMSKTIDDFRNFFRPSKEKVIFDVEVAIKEVLFLIKFTMKGIKIKLDYEIDGPAISAQGNENIDLPDSESRHLIKGYPNEFKQVLLNLFNNARDAIIGKTNNGVTESSRKKKSPLI